MSEAIIVLQAITDVLLQVAITSGNVESHASLEGLYLANLSSVVPHAQDDACIGSSDPASYSLKWETLDRLFSTCFKNFSLPCSHQMREGAMEKENEEKTDKRIMTASHQEALPSTLNPHSPSCAPSRSLPLPLSARIGVLGMLCYDTSLCVSRESQARRSRSPSSSSSSSSSSSQAQSNLLVYLERVLQVHYFRLLRIYMPACHPTFTNSTTYNNAVFVYFIWRVRSTGALEAWSRWRVRSWNTLWNSLFRSRCFS